MSFYRQREAADPRLCRADAGTQPGAHGLDPETDMGPLVDEKQLRTVSQYIETGVEEGARLISGGRRLNGSKFDHGWFLEPTLFDDVRPEMRISQEEIFGPVVTVYVYP